MPPISYEWVTVPVFLTRMTSVHSLQSIQPVAARTELGQVDRFALLSLEVMEHPPAEIVNAV